MSRWDEQLKNHAIHETISQLKEWGSRDLEPPDSDGVSEQLRYLKILNLFEEQLKHVDADIFPFPQLDQLNSFLRNQNTWNQVQAYSGNGNHVHLVNANNQISSQLELLSNITVSSKKSKPYMPLKQVEKLVKTYINQLSSKISDLKDEITVLERGVSNGEERLDIQARDLVAHKESGTNLLSDWQKQFSDDQASRLSEFGTTLNRITKDISKKFDDFYEKKSAEVQNKTEQLTAEIITLEVDAKNRHKDVMEVFGLIAGENVAASYVIHANEEKQQANFWRWSSIVFIALAVGWLFYAFEVNSSFNLGALFGTISLTGVLLFGAGYSAQQSTKHRKAQRMSHQFSLEINSLDPFIATLNEVDRAEMKKQITAKLFGNKLDDNVEHEKPWDVHPAATLLKEISDFVEKIKNPG